MISNTPLMRQSRSHNPVESTDMHFNQNMSPSPMNNQQVMPMTSSYYERARTYKRKNDFGDASTYRPDKIMRTTNYNMVHGLQKETDYESMGMSTPDKRHFPLSGTSSDTSTLPKVFDRHNLGSGDGKWTVDNLCLCYALNSLVCVTNNALCGFYLLASVCSIQLKIILSCHSQQLEKLWSGNIFVIIICKYYDSKTL